MSLFNRKKTLYSVGNGTIIPLSKVNDEVFSSGMMGCGFALIDHDGQVFSPVTGEISNIFPTKHAITIKSKDGIEVLIHMGIDTVDLHGIPFNLKISKGQKIKQGDLIAEMDIQYIEKNKKDSIIIVVLPEKENTNLLINNKKANISDKVFNY